VVAPELNIVFLAEMLVASVIHSLFGHNLKASPNESYNGANCYKQEIRLWLWHHSMTVQH